MGVGAARARPRRGSGPVPARVVGGRRREPGPAELVVEVESGEPGACGVSWLSFKPASGTVNGGSELPITVNLSAASLAPDVLRHRLVMSYAALAEGITPDTVVNRVLELVPAPRLEIAMEPTA